MKRQIERSLQHEVMLRLEAAPVVAFPIPNSVYYPVRSAYEKTLVARLVHQLKLQGALVPGAPDIAVFGPDGSGAAIELKRPKMRTLFGRQPKGKLSKVQRDQAARFQKIGARYAVCSSWDEVRNTLVGWGMLPAEYGYPARRVVQRDQPRQTA